MTNTVCSTIHPRHAHLVAGIQQYLSDAGKSARWLGLTVANDPRLVPNLKRGRHYPTEVLLGLSLRLQAFYERQLAAERVIGQVLSGYAEQRLAA